jgi:hypothetical protein
MKTEPFHEISPLEVVKVAYDTWGIKTDAGSWCIAPDFSFTSLSVQEVNDWFAMTVDGTLDAFSHLVRAWQIYFTPIYRDDIQVMKFEWHPEDSYNLYLENVLRAIQTYSAPIHMMEIDVDLLAYVRTTDSPKYPVKSWIKLPSKFTIWGGYEKRKPYLCFEIDHTLFRPYSQDGEENIELYSLNHSLLEQALSRWEKNFGSICDVDGLSGIYKYGFSEQIEDIEN